MHLNTPFHHKRKQSFALVATLALLAVATILLVLFVSTTTLDRSASHSYSQSVKADQIGLGGLHLVVSQLQAEMYKDGMPDTGGGLYPNALVFTNVFSSNILPQANAANSSLPSLVKMSTNALFFSGGTNTTSTTYRNGVLMATSASSTTPSLNGRSVSTNVWNQIYLGQYPSSQAAPYWVIMTRGGATSAASPAIATLKDSTVGNTGYAVGRFAFAVYDEGSLLDINAAGYPSSISQGTAQFNQIKGTLAGADLTQIPGITNAPALVAWRNSVSSASAGSYVSYINNFASTNGFQQTYPGDSAFVSRQDLIRAAQTGGEGLTTDALPYLATFTRELNAPTWGPSSTNGTATKYMYAKNALVTTASPFSATVGSNKEGGQNPNTFVPFIRYSTAGWSTNYAADGSISTNYFNIGDSVVHRRFPLDRLAWVTPKGPSALLPTSDPFYNAGGTVAAIQACFGLYWAASEVKYAAPPSDTGNWTGIKLWKYVGSTAAFPTTENATVTGSPIENLADVAKESPPREPNFFELLQAGILSGSLGINFGAQSNFQFMSNVDQQYPAYQLLRIGANIITQAQGAAYPINIEYNNNGYSFVASGVANLPYLNALKFTEGMDGATTNVSPTSVTPMATYGLIGLWNPHQQSSASLTRPNVRVYVQGTVTLASGWASTYPVVPSQSAVPNYGLSCPMTTNTFYVQLANTSGSGTGVNGFLNPFAITSSDVDASHTSPTYVSGSIGWTSGTTAVTYQSTPTPNADAAVTYEALRFPNVNLTLQQSGTGVPGYTAATQGTNTESTSLGQVHFSTILGDPRTTAGATPTAAQTTTNMFQIITKYQDPNDSTGNTFVPYGYWSGNNSSATWWGQFTMAGPTVAPSYTKNATNYPTVSGPPYYSVPTVDQTMHSSLVNNNLRYHSGTMMTPDPRVTLFSIFPMSGDDPVPSGGINGTIVNPMMDSIWSGSANTTAPFNICGLGGGGSGGPSTQPAVPGELNTVPSNFKNWFLPAYLSRNNTPYPNAAGTSAAGGTGTWFTAYQDTDGIQRIGDSGLFPTASGASSFVGTSGNPYYDPADTATNSIAQRVGDRPIILNRPFASVGELGYVCRDDPWRTLDFFSAFNSSSTSADSGLLDLFTVTDSPSPVVAGRVNLNTKNGTVLQAIFSGTTADPTGNTLTSPYTMSNPAAMATAFTNYTQAVGGPLVNKDQLVTKFSPYLPTGSTSTSPFGSVDEQNVKAFREAYVRALADVGQTRTWNLLIDLVAQAGKYPTAATNLDQFEVEGERHYWLHIAIDRFTGKIIDRQLELIGP
jgi:hypothetical protein